MGDANTDKILVPARMVIRYMMREPKNEFADDLVKSLGKIKEKHKNRKIVNASVLNGGSHDVVRDIGATSCDGANVSEMFSL